MTKRQPEWILNLSLQLALVVGLGMFVLGLSVGVAPLTVLWRSGLVFVVFALLGGVTSFIWQMPEPPEEIAVEADNEAVPKNQEEILEI